MEDKMTRAKVEAARQTAKTLRISRRSIFYFIRTVLIILVTVLLCVLAFICASRVSNLYILISEGMPLRADSMLHGVDDPDLTTYFTPDCIRNDATLRAQSMSAYEQFTFSGYEYDITIDKMHVFPWQTRIYVDAIEQISSIKGSASTDASSAEIPAWTPIRYRLDMEHINGRWYISAISLIEVNPKLPAENTPDPNRSPIPMATFTPEPSAIIVTMP